MALRLRALRLDDEAAFIDACKTMDAEGWEFAFYYELGMDFAEYLALLDDATRGVGVPKGHVASTFLVADVGGEIVGRTSVRHADTDFLLRAGGHVGYCVLAPFRGRGWGHEILRQSLPVAKAAGRERVLLTCDETNEASRRVIEACGGEPEGKYSGADVVIPKLRYWIHL